MFVGTYENCIDAKSRMIIPSKFRSELGYKCFISTGIDKCMYIYTLESWERWRVELEGLPETDADARAFKRMFLGNASECEIDKQGRITVPSILRDYAGLGKELVTVGVGNKVEVWSKAIFEDGETVPKMDGQTIAESMAKYGI